MRCKGRSRSIKKKIKKDGAGKCGGLRFSIGLLGVPRQSGEPSVSVGLSAAPGETFTNTHTRARAHSGIVFHIKTPFSWPACFGMTPSRKCIMNLTNITSLYGYPSTCHFSTNCSRNVHTVCSLEILSRISYVCEGTLLPTSHFNTHFLRSNNLTVKFTVLTGLYGSATSADSGERSVTGVQNINNLFGPLTCGIARSWGYEAAWCSVR